MSKGNPGVPYNITSPHLPVMLGFSGCLGSQGHYQGHHVIVPVCACITSTQTALSTTHDVHNARMKWPLVGAGLTNTNWCLMHKCVCGGLLWCQCVTTTRLAMNTSPGTMARFVTSMPVSSSWILTWANNSCLMTVLGISDFKFCLACSAQVILEWCLRWKVRVAVHTSLSPAKALQQSQIL